MVTSSTAAMQVSFTKTCKQLKSWWNYLASINSQLDLTLFTCGLLSNSNNIRWKILFVVHKWCNFGINFHTHLIFYLTTSSSTHKAEITRTLKRSIHPKKGVHASRMVTWASYFKFIAMFSINSLYQFLFESNCSNCKRIAHQH